MVIHRYDLKKIKFSSILTTVILFTICILIIAFSRYYFSQSIFYMNDQKYIKTIEQPIHIVYQTRNGPGIKVIPGNDKQVVRINKKEYIITRTEEINGPIFYADYPNGKKYKVENHSLPYRSF